MTAWLRLLGLEAGADVHHVLRADWALTRPLPGVWLAVVVALALLLAGMNFLPFVAMRPSVRVATAVLRLGMAALLLAVLAGVEWRLHVALNQPQQWLAVVDDSASMATRDVGGQSRFAVAMTELAAVRAGAPGPDWQVRSLSGAALGDAAGQGPTLIEAAVRTAALPQARLDRLILFTDGRDSEGRDLRALGEDLKARGIALSVRLLGAAVAPTDHGLSAVPEQTVLRLGEELVVRGAVRRAGAGEVTVTLKENDKSVKTQSVPATEAAGFTLTYKPPRVGRFVYTVELPATDTVAADHRAVFCVDVLEQKINVLLLEGYPRFEFKVLKNVLEVDPLVRLVSVTHLPGGGVYVQGEPLHRQPQEGLIGNRADLFRYDVVILRDLSRSYFRAGGDIAETRLQYLVEFVTKRGGGLLVLGGQDVYRAGGYEDSALAPLLPFDLSDALGKEPQYEGLFYVSIPRPAFAHPLLRLLANPGENRERLTSLRQLDGSNNVGRFKPAATPLLSRTVATTDKDGKPVSKEVPVLGALSVGDGKVLAASVDTLWRWQLQPDFADPPLTMLLANAVRFLAPPPWRRPDVPGITLGDPLPQVGQDLELSAELRDANFEPVRNAELVVTVTRPDATTQKLYPRDLPEEPGVYRYRVALPQPGRYQVTAEHGKFSAQREFLAGAAASEFADLSSDRAGLARLVDAAGGEFIGDLAAWQKQTPQAPTTRAAVRDLEIWNSPAVLVLFLVFLALDCYLRKRQGLA